MSVKKNDRYPTEADFLGVIGTKVLRVFPETSTKLYGHEFGFRTHTKNV